MIGRSIIEVEVRSRSFAPLGSLARCRLAPYIGRMTTCGGLEQMPQSLARLHVHLVFSTKYRRRVLHEQVRPDLHAYMAAVLQNLGCQPVIVNSVEDHVHVLFELARTVALCDAVEEVKKTSSKWIKTQGPEFAHFAWQAGYGAFAVSSSKVADVSAYIANQGEHHRKKAYQDEYRGFLKRHGISFEEKYVWD